MYFLEQIKRQFLSNICLYGLGAEVQGGAEQLEKPTGPKKPESEQVADLANKSRDLGDRMNKKGPKFAKTGEALKGESRKSSSPGEKKESGSEKNEPLKEIEAVSKTEALSTVKPRSPEERKLAQEMHKTGESVEDIQTAIYEQRLEKMASNEITDGEREVIEAEFISEIAAESGISAELMTDMRALGFADLQSGTPEETAGKLREFVTNMEKLNHELTKDGRELPKTKEEFIALYEVYQDNKGNIPVKLSDEDVSGLGDEVVLDANGNIDPEFSLGYEKIGDTVVGPPGKPYSRNGEVFSGYRGKSGGFEGGGKAIDLENLPAGADGVRDIIVQAEAEGNYDIIYSGCPIKPPKPLTEMTVKEVSNFQDRMVAAGSASSACGGIQIIRKTLDPYVEKYPDQKFDEAFQNKLIIAKMEERGLSKYKNGSISDMKFMESLSQEWASLPKDMSGASYYAGDGLNHALVKPNDLLQQIRTIRGSNNDSQTIA